MNATDVWEDMNMISRYIDEVHTYTIGCGLHNMSIYIGLHRYSFRASRPHPITDWSPSNTGPKSPDGSTDGSVSFPTNGNGSRISYMTRIDSVLLKRKYIGLLSIGPTLKRQYFR